MEKTDGEIAEDNLDWEKEAEKKTEQAEAKARNEKKWAEFEVQKARKNAKRETNKFISYLYLKKTDITIIIDI